MITENMLLHVFKALERSPSSAATVRKPYVIPQDKNEDHPDDIGTADVVDPNYDGAPYCSYGHRTKASCDCGPIADNE